MRNMPKFKIWVLILAIIFAICLIGLTFLLIRLFPDSQSQNSEASIITVIPAATSTPLVSNEFLFTPTVEPTKNVIASASGLKTGDYVKISGTDGEGLRMRSGAGLDSPVRFMGMDEEVFKIDDGPIQADGYTWWYLIAPYDANRSGWAADQFLTYINNQQ